MTIDINGRLKILLQVPPEVRKAAAELLERLQEGAVALTKEEIRYPREGGVLLKCGFARKVNGAEARTIALRPGTSVAKIAAAIRKLAQNSAPPPSRD